MTRPPRETDAPLAWAEYYLSLGWVLSYFPPGTKGPQTDDWNTPAQWIDTPEKARTQWSARPTYGMGLIHEPSGTVAIDVDDVPLTRRVFAEFGLDIDKLLVGAPRIHGKREGRDKAIFRAPEGEALKLHRIAWRHPSDRTQHITLFELRAGAVHDCLPPSQHPDGHRYAWRQGLAPWETALPTLPADLLAFWREYEGLKAQIAALSPWAAPVTYSLPAARCARDEHNDVIGQFNQAYTVDALLRSNGYERRGKRYIAPSSKSRIPGVVVLDDNKVYSHHAGDDLNDGHAHDAFSLFTLFNHGGDVAAAVRAAGDELGIPFAGPVLSTIDFPALLGARRNGHAPSPEKPPFPAHLLEVPGLVGEIAAFINQTARYPQPILALAAAIAAAATFMGRKVRTETDLRTNIYILGVAEAGAGKEHARQALRTLFDHAGAFKRVAVEGIASDAALNTALVGVPSSLFLLDEIGRFLAVLNDQRAGSHLSEIITQLLKVYSAAAGPYCGKVYADAERNTVVQQPNLSIYGTTVPGTFHDALTTAQIEDGFLSRLLIFESEDADPEPRDTLASPPPHSLIEQCVAWERAPEHADAANNNVDALLRPSPRVVAPDPAARVLLSRFEREMRERRKQLRAAGKPAALYVRTAANAQKLALIRAAGRSLENPTITAADAEWACALALYLADSMAWRVLAHVAENRTERDVKRVAALIRAAGADGLLRSEITKRTQFLRQAERNDVLATLIQAGDVVRTVVVGTTRPGERFTWATFVAAAEPAKDKSDSEMLQDVSTGVLETSLNGKH